MEIKCFSAIIFMWISCFMNSLFAQSELKKLEAKVADKKTSEPLAYTNIYNLSIRKGTISNLEGYFKIELSSPDDTILFSYVGYHSYSVSAKEIMGKEKIFLEQKSFLLKDITVTAKNDFLYDLLSSCKKSQTNKTRTAKTYFELESYIDSTQVELVETYTNGHYAGYDVEKMEMKEGRLGFIRYNDRSFVSTETSKSFIFFRLFSSNEYFPRNPLEMNKNKLKKQYLLTLSQKYTDEKSRIIYVIDFTPKDSAKNYFKGRVWIDSLKRGIVKINLQAENCFHHPFLPLVPDDTLKKVNLELTETFVEIDGRYYFNHTDFNYKILYKESHDRKFINQKNSAFEVNTHAVLYAYNYDEIFNLPFFRFPEYKHADYRKIGSVPYNSFFWNNHHEFKLNDRKDKNELFLNNPDIFNTRYNSILKWSDSSYRRNFHEATYTFWSPERICFLYHTDTVPNHVKVQGSVIPSDLYKLKAQLYLDFNQINDSINFLTKTIFDPFQSYYFLPFDTMADCFLNIYFDIMEIQRRELEKELPKSFFNFEFIKTIYQNRIIEAEKTSDLFFKDAERGRNKEGMIKWSKYVYDKLKIDNLKAFNLYQE